MDAVDAKGMLLPWWEREGMGWKRPSLLGGQEGSLKVVGGESMLEQRKTEDGMSLNKAEVLR